MADNADRTDLVLERVDRSLAALAHAQPGRVLEECEECGYPIPFERVQALAKMECLRCVECQGYHERRVRG